MLRLLIDILEEEGAENDDILETHSKQLHPNLVRLRAVDLPFRILLIQWFTLRNGSDSRVIWNDTSKTPSFH